MKKAYCIRKCTTNNHYICTLSGVCGTWGLVIIQPWCTCTSRLFVVLHDSQYVYFFKSWKNPYL